MLATIIHLNMWYNYNNSVLSTLALSYEMEKNIKVSVWMRFVPKLDIVQVKKYIFNTSFMGNFFENNSISTTALIHLILMYQADQQQQQT